MTNVTGPARSETAGGDATVTADAADVTDGIEPAGVIGTGPAAPGRRAARRMPAGEGWFLVGIVLSQVYYAYRYILRVSDTGTSPTYADTPTSLQAGKYLLMLVIAAGAFGSTIVAARNRRIRAQRTGGFAGGLALYLWWVTVLAVVGAFVSGPGNADTLVRGVFFLPLLLCMPLFFDGERSVARFVTVLLALVAYHTVFEGYEFFAYYTQGRLPALAYPNGGLVRFGAGLDDPNGFGAFIALPLLLVIAGWPRKLRGFWRVVALLAMVWMLLSTVSYTAILTLLIGLLAYAVLSRQFGKLLVGVLVAFVAASGVLASGLISRTIDAKAKSAGTRFQLSTSNHGGVGVLGFLRESNPAVLLFGRPGTGVHSETDYIYLTINFGLPLALFVVFLLLTTIRRGAIRTRRMREAGRTAEARLFAALTAFVLAVAIGSLGVPLINVFPTNLMLWVVAMIIWLPYSPERPAQRGDGRWRGAYADGVEVLRSTVS